MPFKSESQRRKFYVLNKQGKISDRELATWERHTKDKNLPERKRKEEKK